MSADHSQIAGEGAENVGRGELGQNLIFIIGMPRSGTKLLRQLMNQHARIRIPEVETEFFPLLAKYIAKNGDCSDYEDFLCMFEHMDVLPYFTYMREQGRAVDCRLWYEACVDYNAAGIFTGLLLVSTDSTGAANVFVGDKSPSYINQLDLLNASFPNACFIHIVRDARDYCLSINRAWGKNMVRAASRWSASVDGFLKMKNRLKCHELRYEDLVSNPQRELERVCDFIGIPFESKMTAPAAPVENLGDARGVLEVMPQNTQKFEKLMSASLRQKIEQVACKEMRNYGYVTQWQGEPRNTGAVANLALQILDGINLVRHERRNRGIIGSIVFYWRYFRATRAL